MASDRLRTLVDFPRLQAVLAAEAAGRSDPGALLAWYAEADRLVGQEVGAGRATADDAAGIQEEFFALGSTVPGLQFVTNEPFGQARPAT